METFKLTLLALRFPELTTFCYETITKTRRVVEGLSPEARKNLHYCYMKLHQFMVIAITHLIAIYPTVLKFGEIKIEEWTEPSIVVLRFLAAWILFWFPVTVTEDESRETKKVIYVGNQQAYAFGTLNLLAHVYQKDKILLRTIVDQFHFKIPIWKQILEYFGCVPDSPENIELVTSLGHPVLIYPGGSNEFFKFNPDYTLDFNPNTLTFIIEIASRYDYSFIPFGNVGGVDMYNCLVNLPYNFNLDTLPILIPSSYQRQYLTIQKDIKYSGLGLPVYLDMVKDVTRNVEMSKTVQSGDSKRYLLLFLHKVNVKLQEKFLQRDGVVVRGITEVSRVARKGVEGVIKMGIRRFSETPGPTIEELEE